MRPVKYFPTVSHFHLRIDEAREVLFAPQPRADVHLHHQDGRPTQIMAVQGGWLQLLMSSNVHQQDGRSAHRSSSGGAVRSGGAYWSGEQQAGEAFAFQDIPGTLLVPAHDAGPACSPARLWVNEGGSRDLVPLLR